MMALLLAGSTFKLSAEVYPDNTVIGRIGYYICWEEEDGDFLPLYAVVGWHNGEISGNLVIPSTINITYENWYGSPCFATIPVVIIESGAFFNCAGITNLTIGDNVTYIGSSAFEGCSGLTCIDISNSVTTIDDRAFYGCSNLATLSIGKSVNSIGQFAFFLAGDNYDYVPIIDDNTGADIDFSNDFPVFKDENGFSRTIVDYAHNDFHCKLKELTWNAQHCESYGRLLTSTIEKINIGDEVEILPDCFAQDSKISEITIPNSVKIIGDCAFIGCNNLTRIEIPESVSEIGKYALFTDSPYIFWLYDEETDDYVETRYYLTEGGCNMREFTWNAIHCESVGGELVSLIEKINIGEGVEILPPSFASRTKITEIGIPNSVTTIGNYAFYCCSGLTSIDMGDSVTSIGDEAFLNCSGLSRLTIGKSVTHIGNQAFKNCLAIKDLNWRAKECWSQGNMPKSNIEKVTIGNEVEFLPEGFVSGSQITEVTIPENVSYISNYAFYDCPNLGTLYWNAKDCGHYYNADSDENSYTFHPFSSCSKIIFGKNVESIHLSVRGRWLDTIWGGLFYCGSDTVISHAIVPPTISMPNLTEMDWGLDLYFFDNYENAVLFVPKGSIEAYLSADYWRKFLTIKELENTPSLPGDLNGDGEVGIADINTLIDAILAKNGDKFYDMNGDGEVTIADVTELIELFLSNH